MKLPSNKTAKLFKHLNCKKRSEKNIKKTSELLTKIKAEINPSQQQIDIKSYNGLSIFQDMDKNALKTSNFDIETYRNHCKIEQAMKKLE